MERRAKSGTIALLGIILIVGIFVYPYLFEGNGKIQEGGELIISINFGEKTIKDVRVETNVTVMKALEENANITTAYGGRFVTSIDGISQNSTFFWFYYVNGLLSNVGAEDYVIHPGDVIRWDYHSWKGTPVYAEVEDFPEPLVHGYGGKSKGTLIVYQNGYGRYATELKNYLGNLGVNVTLTQKVEGAYNGNMVVIGTPEIAKSINGEYKKLGFRFHVENSHILDPHGNMYRGAFVEASQSPFTLGGVGSCEGILIWIYSTNPNYMEDAIKTIINKNVDAFWYFSGEKI